MKPPRYRAFATHGHASSIHHANLFTRNNTVGNAASSLNLRRLSADERPCAGLDIAAEPCLLFDPQLTNYDQQVKGLPQTPSLKTQQHQQQQ